MSPAIQRIEPGEANFQKERGAKQSYKKGAWRSFLDNGRIV